MASKSSKAYTLMVQGTTSDAGKSTLVIALCRWLKRKGVRVVPFKPQNMALNGAMTDDGGEIGRAQALQALACGLRPHSDMNPVLLKPTSDKKSQVILQGKAIEAMDAIGYQDYKRVAMEAILDSYQRLQLDYEVIVVEGAGSPAEINLRANDVANMGFAETVDCPVIIIADIDRGGVFAHLVGTLALLSEREQQRVKGFVINRFRGDLALLEPGLIWLQEYTGKPVLGVLPYVMDLKLESEDGIDVRQTQQALSKVRIAVFTLPRIIHHTDVDPLRFHPQVELLFVGPGDVVPDVDLIILPGSQNVREDLNFLREQGWDQALLRHLRYGGKVLGIGEGMYMLGDRIGVSEEGEFAGLGLLTLHTNLRNHAPRQIEGNWCTTQEPVLGFVTSEAECDGEALTRPIFSLSTGQNEGAISQDGVIMATQLHGFLTSPGATRSLLTWLGLQNVESMDYRALQEKEIDRLADLIDLHMDTALLKTMLGLSV